MPLKQDYSNEALIENEDSLFIKDHLDDLMFTPEYESYSASENPTTELITRETDAARRIKRIAKTVITISRQKQEIFSYSSHTGAGDVLWTSSTGRDLIWHISKDLLELEEMFPSHALNPMIAALQQAMLGYPDLAYKVHARPWTSHRTRRKDIRFAFGHEASTICAQMNALVNDLRSIIASPLFTKKLDHRRRQFEKNHASAAELIHSLFQLHSRLLVVRIDLTCGNENEETRGIVSTTGVNDAKTMHDKFIRFVRNKYKIHGHMSKFEYGLLTGYHFHVLLFLDGHAHCQDITIAKFMGEHWSRQITEGRGRYYNCNAAKYKDRGVGMIGYGDTLLRKVSLDKVVSYLTKTDFWLKFNNGGRTFFKSQLPLKLREGVIRPGAPRSLAVKTSI